MTTPAIPDNRLYEFTGETIKCFGATLYQIRAKSDIPYSGVKAGDIGGYIESPQNLSGHAWVSDNAQVFGNAHVYGNARIFDNAEIFDNARVSDHAWISGNARVFGGAWVFGGARVFDDARVFGDAWVSGSAWIFGSARVKRPHHYLVVGPVGSENATATLWRGKGRKHGLKVGCWEGIPATLMAEVKRRRRDWGGTEIERETWTTQYKELKALCKATIARWDAEG